MANDRETLMYKQAGLLADLLVKPVLGTGRLAANLIQGAVDAGVNYPYLIGIPVLGRLAGIAAGTRNSPLAEISWADPRKREYTLRPGILFHRLEKDRYTNGRF